MYFTLAVSAATRQACAALADAARDADPRIMPVPGPARVAWLAADERAAVLCWPAGTPPPDPPAHGRPGETPAPDLLGLSRAASHAGTIWADHAGVHARTGVTRVDPVYVAEIPGAVLLSDRACWAAAVTGGLADHDPVLLGALLSLGYPVGAATPFRRVRAVGRGTELTIADGRLVVERARRGDGQGGRGGAGPVADALVEAVRPLRDATVPVELSLTGGKDSRLIAAALTAAKVPFRARTHGFASHPDVVVAGMIAAALGVEHVVTEPASGGTQDETDVVGRLRSAVLLSDGMLSAFENLGRPDPAAARPASQPVQTGGHGGELLRGGYAQAAWRCRGLAGLSGSVRALSSAAGVELFRRMTTRRLRLLRPAAAGAYLAGLAPAAAVVARGPLHALDDFYLVNRAGRWSAAARQAYLLRSPLVQPFFADRVVLAARAVPLPQRITDRLHREVLAALCPDLLGIPLAGAGWKCGPRTPGKVSAGGPTPPDWRRSHGDRLALLLREYALDADGAGRMFDFVRRPAAERALRPPHADPAVAWALATVAALLSGDWLNARAGVSPGRNGSPPARSTPRPRPA